ncbi:hypothetical protein ASPBRDRAFT_276459 [Aspergillus brasiliensis CBS 101740]|uniref:Uncharacterized protein n=1 Tax=Aspergillus brasiliensis (strain CBS 101740 / IMI 381727 / IBT 21946) TaxID=767769 RepID=A0A1L9UCI9_ASPBC|nr:hypothetical protein ASPBRDRAFT_276459 [Aspergillus brasiliensis CBS 101740]
MKIIIHRKQEGKAETTMPMAAYIHALLSALHEQHKGVTRVRKKAGAGKPKISSQRTRADVRKGDNPNSLSTQVVQFENLVEKKQEKKKPKHTCSRVSRSLSSDVARFYESLRHRFEIRALSLVNHNAGRHVKLVFDDVPPQIARRLHRKT